MKQNIMVTCIYGRHGIHEPIRDIDGFDVKC